MTPPAAGSACIDRLVRARREALKGLVARWKPAQHDKVRALLDRLARDLVAEAPDAPGRG